MEAIKISRYLIIAKRFCTQTREFKQDDIVSDSEFNSHELSTGLSHSFIKLLDEAKVTKPVVKKAEKVIDLSADINNDGFVDEEDVKLVKSEAKRHKRSRKKRMRFK